MSPGAVVLLFLSCCHDERAGKNDQRSTVQFRRQEELSVIRMNWLDKLDDAIDRALIPGQEGDDSMSCSTDDHPEPGAHALHDSLTRLRTQVSELSGPIMRHVVKTRPSIESESDHFVASVSEQPAGQDSMSAPLEPDSSMLADEHDDKLPASEPSSFHVQRAAFMTSDATVAESSSEDKHEIVKDDPEPDLAGEEAFNNSKKPQHVVDVETDRGTLDVAMENDPSGDGTDVTIHVTNILMKGTEKPLCSEVESDDGVVDVAHDEIGVPAHVTSEKDENLTDFNVSLPLPQWESDVSMHPSLNCYGVVHVRLVGAQRLPCPLGSSIQGIVALPPWQGRVRTERTTAFLGPEQCGVCVRWDQLHDGGCCSMVHAWNSLETPIPTVKIDLVFHPLQMLEFPMCSVSLSCKPLLYAPGVWKRQWCHTTISQKVNDPEGFLTADDRVPLILVEALFVPSGMDENPPESIGHYTQEEDEASVELSPSVGTIASHSPKSRKRNGSVASGSTFMLTSRIPSKPHLLRIETFWIPATCAACKTIMAGWKCAFRCEECNIDCCKDCQLQVDLQVPCGSTVAKASVAASFHNKLTVPNIMNIIAPWDESSKKVPPLPESKITHSAHAPKLRNERSELFEEPSIGTLKMHVIRACLFEQPLHPDSNPDDFLGEKDTRTLRKGDYYVRISTKERKGSTRTRTVQNTGKPQFDTSELVFNVPHYGMEYRIDVVDAHTDKPIGTTLLTAQGVLQWQRDIIVATNGFAMIPLFQRPSSCTEERRWRLELRKDIKSGFHDDFFVSSKSSKSSSGSKRGEISGWLDIDLCLTEDMDRLYGPRPIECPPRPPAELNVELFQLYIARLGMLVEDGKSGAAAVSYAISWKNPAFTSLTLILFVSLCLRFNSEYVGCLPFFFLAVYMLHLAAVRRSGRLKDRFLERERKVCIESEKQVSVKYAVHRPIARLHVAVHQGKNIRSRDLGLPGSAGSRIYWDPLRYCENEKKKALLISVDSSLAATHEIGLSNFHFSANPIWDKMNESEETKRLQQLLPNHGEFFGAEPATSSHESHSTSKVVSQFEYADCVFPVLQPIRAAQRQQTIGEKVGGDHTIVELEPWDSIQGAVVIEVRFKDVLNKLPGFDDVLGEVSFPLSKLIAAGEIRGWYQISEQGTTSTDALMGIGDYQDSPSNKKSSPSENMRPQVYVDIKWISPEPNDDNVESEREAAVVIAEELIRSAARTQNTEINLMGSSIGAFSTVAGLSGNVRAIQNTLGSTLDVVESARNAFNFTDPYKSSIVFCILLALWLFLALVPTRLLILLGGLALYTRTFLAAFGPSAYPGDKKPAKEEPLNQEQKLGSPFTIWLTNALRGLPTDEDLRKAYFWESRRVGEQERSRLADQKRTARLKRLWRAQWYSTVQLKMQHGRKTSLGERDWQWKEAFGIVQGHRFLWWRSVQDFDNGESPVGRIFLAGHAGLAGLSPLDLRQLDDNEKPLVVSIFGCGLDGQQKLTLLTGNIQLKEGLEKAVLEAATKED